MSQITVLDKSNVPTGPFTRAQVAEKLQSGEIALSNLAFVDGMTEWTPLQQVLARVDSMTISAPARIGISAPVAATASTPPAYSYAATMAPPSHLAYAGFWLRFVAYLIDGLIISVVVLGVSVVLGGLLGVIAFATGTQLTQSMFSDQTGASPAAVAIILVIEVVVYLGTLILAWLYFAKLESGSAQATYGKRVMGLKVTDMAGQRIGFGRASGRFFGKIVSSMTFYIGFIMAGFTERKQALHDMIAGTLVTKG
jgi:uncharacterized RDD family membrane protein YckC